MKLVFDFRFCIAGLDYCRALANENNWAKVLSNYDFGLVI